MATIKDGSTSTQLSVDAVSKAARVSLYDPTTGLPMASNIRGTGFDLDTSANVDMRDAIAIAVPGAGGAQVAGTAGVPLRTDPTGSTTQPVSGSVAITNLPTTQAVSGTVTVANPVGAVQVNNFPATQAVSGTVAVNNHPTNQTVNGTVNIGNLPTTQPVSGSVSVSNFPAFPTTQTVAGSVSVSNFPAPPANQAVSGSVSVSNFPAFPATQTVAGAVSVSNLPATQNVAGTVGANVRVSGADVTQANPLWVDGFLTIDNTSANPVPVTTIPAEYGQAYATSLDLQPTTVADATTFWSMRNSGTKTIFIRRIDIQAGFIGTAAASRSTFGFYRFAGTPAGGATTIATKKATTSAASVTTLLSANAGLSVAGVTWDAAPFQRCSNVNQLNSNGVQSLDFGNTEAAHLQLAPGEGVAVRAVGAIVAGAFMAGAINWYER